LDEITSIFGFKKTQNPGLKTLEFFTRIDPKDPIRNTLFDCLPTLELYSYSTMVRFEVFLWICRNAFRQFRQDNKTLFDVHVRHVAIHLSLAQAPILSNWISKYFRFAYQNS
jgi:hypothetical protein